MDRLVCRAAAAALSRSHRLPDRLYRAGGRRHGVSTAHFSHRLLLLCHLARDRHHPHGQLCLLELSGSCTRNLSFGRCLSAGTSSLPLEPGGRQKAEHRSKHEIRAQELVGLSPVSKQNVCCLGGRAFFVVRPAGTYERRNCIPCGGQGPRNQTTTGLAAGLVRRGVVGEGLRFGLGALCHALPSPAADFARTAVAGKTGDGPRTVSRGEFLWPVWPNDLGSL